MTERQRRFTVMAAAAIIATSALYPRIAMNEKWSLKGSQTLQTTALRRVPSFCIETSRCKHLHMDSSRHFSWVHISKCAGKTWKQELNNLGVNIYPPRKDEHSVQFINNQDPSSFRSYSLVSLKSPRHHVWSLFTQCKYGPWGIKMTKNTNFPRSGENDVADFDQWLNHFLDKQQQQHPAGVDRYNCYHPANYQSQFLSTDFNAHQSHGRTGNNVPLVAFDPNWTTVEETYWSFDWVAVVDFNHESKCLLYHRLLPKTDMIVDYLNNTCTCDGNRSIMSNTLSDVKIQHHQEGHVSELRTLPEQVLRKVAILTRVDMKLYVEALHQFIKEIVWLESELGRQVLCRDVLEEREPELAYLNVSVTDLYRRNKKAQ